MGTKRNYNLSHRLIACILFIGLFLQSCSGFKNQTAPQEEKQPIRAIELSDNPLFNTEQAIVTSGGYLASFYEEDGELKTDLRADEKQPNPNYKCVPVLVEEGADLACLTKLDPKTQQNRIELNRSNRGQLRHITIRKGGLSGGMMEGSQKTSQIIPELTDIKELRRHFTKGYLEITPKNYRQLIEFSENQPTLFTNYEGGLCVKGWEASTELDALIDLLLSFSNVKKFKINFAREDEVELAEVVGKAVQFYKELTELDLNGCGLGDLMMEDMLESIAAPEKLRILNVSNNNLSANLLDSLQTRFANVKVICSTASLERRFLQSMNQLSISTSEGKLAKNKERGEEEKGKGKELTLNVAGQNEPRNFISSPFKFLNVPEPGSPVDPLPKAVTEELPFTFTFRSINYPHFEKQEYQSNTIPSFNFNIPEFKSEATRPLLPEIKEVGNQRVLYKALTEYQKAEIAKLEATTPDKLWCIKEAAEQGNKYSQYNFGLMYEQGIWVEKDREKAAEWYIKAAEQEQFERGQAPETLRKLALDGVQLAQEWIIEEAKRGNKYSQYILGLMYEQGIGVEKDEEIAVEWYIKANDQKHSAAPTALCKLALKGNQKAKEGLIRRV